MKFTATVLLSGKTATGVVVPPEIVERLGGGGRSKVHVTIGDHTYRNLHVRSVEGAKTEATRQRRIEKAITLFCARKTR